MYRLNATLSLLCLMVSVSMADVYELRTYTAAKGKLEKLNARFRDHTVALFKKHGMESLGYWVPTDEKMAKNTLIYVLKHKSREAADASWKAFIKDPDWQAAAAQSGVGKLEKIDRVYMKTTDYSPKKWKNGESQKDAVFELRIYQAAEGKLGKLDARFRDHTMRLFEKHGIKNVAYWHPTDEKESKHTLIYIIRHDSREAARKSWTGFGRDPEWHKARDASDVGGLAKRPTSIYMKATDYSAMQ